MLSLFRKKQVTVSPSVINEHLQRVKTPSGVDIITADMVQGLQLVSGSDGAEVSFVLEIDAKDAAVMEPVRQQAEKTLRDLPGVAKVTAVLTAKRVAKEPSMPPARQPKNIKLDLPHLKKIVAVASGKGGVGKSTTSVNLAVALAQMGLRVGLLDSDIYGPSIPRMLNLSDKVETNADKKLIPPERYGLKAMSIGLLLADNAPLVWRGPMVHSAIQQLFRDVAWGELDIVIVDLPPGTGDAQLTLAQTIPLSGAVIVSTPQDIALIDARKGLAMFQKVDVPVLGMIENMSFFNCPHCGGRSDIFHHGGARDEAAKLGIPFLGEMPLNIAIRQNADDGTPITASDPSGELAQLYKAMAQRLWDGLR